MCLGWRLPLPSGLGDLDEASDLRRRGASCLLALRPLTAVGGALLDRHALAATERSSTAEDDRLVLPATSDLLPGGQADDRSATESHPDAICYGHAGLDNVTFGVKRDEGSRRDRVELDRDPSFGASRDGEGSVCQHRASVDACSGHNGLLLLENPYTIP